MLNIALGAVELQAAIVGLITGLIYTAVGAPIPAPNVLGGVLAIIGTFIGMAAVAAARGQLTLG